jgi:hypothetical protein
VNMKLKLLIWNTEERGLYISILNLFPSYLAFSNPLKKINFLNNPIIGDIIEAIFLIKHL